MSPRKQAKMTTEENRENIFHSAIKTNPFKNQRSTPLKSIDINRLNSRASSFQSIKFKLEPVSQVKKLSLCESDSEFEELLNGPCVPTFKDKISNILDEIKQEKRKQESDSDDLFDSETDEINSNRRNRNKVLRLSSNENSLIKYENDYDEPRKQKKRLNIQNNDSENEFEEANKKLRKSSNPSYLDFIEDVLFEDDDDYSEEEVEAVETRRKLRNIINDEDLNAATRRALKDEQRRIKRLEKRKSEKSLAEIAKEEFYLDKEPKSGQPILKIDSSIVKKMKPHQLEGVKFMWESCYETITRVDNNMKGSGCLLAHCMGLGKTLQVISLIHTLLSNAERTKCKRVMILVPKNVLINWQLEIQKWTKHCRYEIPIYQLIDDNSTLAKDKYNQRLDILEEWFNSSGVFLIGYEMFKLLVLGTHVENKSYVERFQTCLIKPGPDLIVCDEGHVLKNATTDLAKVLNKIDTNRRIVLTGTPLQNNLEEYHCMVSFVKPNLLGTLKEFRNRFANPIRNGQHKDSTREDVIMMKKKAHILHQSLEGIVNRKDMTVIRGYLPSKHEYVLSIRLSSQQIELYRTYMSVIRRIKLPDAADMKTLESATLFKDFQILSKIWTHPWLLKTKEEIDLKRKQKLEEKRLKQDKNSTMSRNSMSLGKDYYKDEVAQGSMMKWYENLISPEFQHNINLSGKLVIFNEIYQMCVKKGEKLVVFSQSLMSLDTIEEYLFLQNIKKNKDFYRIDGQVSSIKRQEYIDLFNNPMNTNVSLFLVSTKAGGIGINLYGANRCIIFDATWNPSYDTQSIYRIYRLGQEKQVFVYRFLAQGTMEEKIYIRQVTKNALSQRVVDEHQLDRHYTSEELRELYSFHPEVYDNEGTESYAVPADDILKTLLLNNKHWIMNYHEHDSLLENKLDEGLTEDERKAAWAEYEAETRENEERAKVMNALHANLLPEQQNYLIQNILNVLKNQTISNFGMQTSHNPDEINKQSNEVLSNIGMQVVVNPLLQANADLSESRISKI